MWKVIKYSLIVLFLYTLVGNVLHRLVFPQPIPDYEEYFKKDMVFENQWEGFSQKIIKLDGNKVFTELMIKPLADGPPLHSHTTFSETFEVKRGQLTVIMGKDTVILTRGKALTVPLGIPHKPFNQTDKVVVVGGSKSFLPVDFAYSLSRFYGFLEEDQANTKPPKMFLELAILQSHFDSELKSMPGYMQTIFGWILAPAARLAGYNIYQEKYAPIPLKDSQFWN
ncbi:MAG: cupin domain-containing protein [Bacteroidetes bacterium]|nr:cupin domain-containing protein [Bacteroidota bacterium]